MKRTLDYNFVPNDPYPHQVTITYYPNKLKRLFGAKPTQRLIVTEDWQYFSFWYEFPSMQKYDPGYGDKTIYDIHAMIRQLKYNGE